MCQRTAGLSGPGTSGLWAKPSPLRGGAASHDHHPHRGGATRVPGPSRGFVCRADPRTAAGNAHRLGRQSLPKHTFRTAGAWPLPAASLSGPPFRHPPAVAPLERLPCSTRKRRRRPTGSPGFQKMTFRPVVAGQSRPAEGPTRSAGAVSRPTNDREPGALRTSAHRPGPRREVAEGDARRGLRQDLGQGGSPERLLDGRHRVVEPAV